MSTFDAKEKGPFYYWSNKDLAMEIVRFRSEMVARDAAIYEIGIHGKAHRNLSS